MRSKGHSHYGLIKIVLLIVTGIHLASCGHKLNDDQSLTKQLSGVRIGNQVWSAKNLDVATFRNGDSIPEVRSNEEWEKAGKEGRPAWCYYDNDTRKGKKYGRMYNWYAVTDPRGLAPEGWHIPTNEEWITLEETLTVAHAGHKLKCDHGWMDNGNGDNSSKMCVLAGGYRSRNGLFTGDSEFTYLTSSSDGIVEGSKEQKEFIWGRGIQFENQDAMRCGLDKEFGLYVRCVKTN